ALCLWRVAMRLSGCTRARDEERARRLGVELVEFDDVFRQADVVSLHLRASPKTHQIVGQRELALMKPSAYLVNTGRGALGDEAALYEHLKAGRIRGAAIDVYQTEPLPASSPLLTLDNALVTADVAWV